MNKNFPFFPLDVPEEVLANSRKYPEKKFQTFEEG